MIVFIQIFEMMFPNGNYQNKMANIAEVNK